MGVLLCNNRNERVALSLKRYPRTLSICMSLMLQVIETGAERPQVALHRGMDQQQQTSVLTRKDLVARNQTGSTSRRSQVAAVPLQISLVPLSQSAQDLLAVRDEMSEAVKYVESVLMVNEPLLEPAKSWKGASITSCNDSLQVAGITDSLQGFTGGVTVVCFAGLDTSCTSHAPASQAR
jgi:hypothetical protein